MTAARKNSRQQSTSVQHPVVSTGHRADRRLRRPPSPSPSPTPNPPFAQPTPSSAPNPFPHVHSSALSLPTAPTAPSPTGMAFGGKAGVSLLFGFPLRQVSRPPYPPPAPSVCNASNFRPSLLPHLCSMIFFLLRGTPMQLQSSLLDNGAPLPRERWSVAKQQTVRGSRPRRSVSLGRCACQCPPASGAPTYPSGPHPPGQWVRGE